MSILKIKIWYLAFLERDKKNIFELLLYWLLYIISVIYGLVVRVRNFFYDRNILPSFSCNSKVISVGNISWSGSGKTPLSIWLYSQISPFFKTAVLRRGYGDDENKLLKEKINNVFYDPNRYKLAKSLESEFKVFIVDDGFQHRKLRRDINIVVMGAREFKRKFRLIPAYIFREPLTSLKRADIVILNYADELDNTDKIKNQLLRINPSLKIYCSKYRVEKFMDLKGNKVDKEYLMTKKLAAFAAIGYPQGFFNKLKSSGIIIEQYIVYPDHFELSEKEFDGLQQSLIDNGIRDLIITHKDKYHIPERNIKLNIYIMEIDIEIESSKVLMREIKNKL